MSTERTVETEVSGTPIFFASGEYLAAMCGEVDQLRAALDAARERETRLVERGWETVRGLDLWAHNDSWSIRWIDGDLFMGPFVSQAAAEYSLNALLALIAPNEAAHTDKEG